MFGMQISKPKTRPGFSIKAEMEMNEHLNNTVSIDSIILFSSSDIGHVDMNQIEVSGVTLRKKFTEAKWISCLVVLNH